VPELFYAVGAWYDEFAQLTDEDVCALLYAARRERTA
jgi:predicted phosphoribosyltransferase